METVRYILFEIFRNLFNSSLLLGKYQLPTSQSNLLSNQDLVPTFQDYLAPFKHRWTLNVEHAVPFQNGHVELYFNEKEPQGGTGIWKNDSGLILDVD